MEATRRIQMKIFKKVKAKATLLVISISLVAGYGLYVTAPQATACKKCVTDDARRKCGKCESHKLFVKKSWVNDKGKVRHYYKCDNCGHAFIADSKGVIITNETVPSN